MLKVRLNCPICGEHILAKSLEGHLERVHEITGTVTLRLNPTHPFTHELEEVEAVAKHEAEAEAKRLEEQEAE